MSSRWTVEIVIGWVVGTGCAGGEGVQGAAARVASGARSDAGVGG